MQWPVQVLLWLKFIKVLAVCALASGTLGAFIARDWEDRKRFAFAVAGPGFGLTWVSGILMAVGHSVSLFALWILLSAAASFVSLQITLFCASKAERNSRPAAIASVFLLACAIASMLWRPSAG